MGKNKKIVLFIVEGITDEISLGLVLSRIIEKDKIVRFKIIGGDITTKYGTNSSNILGKITDKIKEFIDRDIYKKKDIQDVVHLVDTDGTYIASTSMVQKDISGFQYDTQNIYANNTEDIRRRNEQKSQVLNKLIGINKVYKDLPYRVYFFSSNLEHVLHNNQSILDDEKDEYAKIFEDKFAVDGDYNHTWDFIKKGTNSLNRYTNFHLYFNNTHIE